MNEICKLCGESKKLCNSHILPHSFTRKIKNGSPQLASIRMSNPPLAIKSNAENKQHLLCYECEQFIKSNYEDYGTVYLSNKTNFTNDANSIIVPNFNYEKYYLFIISIIWRASVSSLQIFKPFKAIFKLEKYLRHCVKNNTLLLHSQGIKIDDFIKISIFRINDSKNEINQNVLDEIILLPNMEHGKTVKEESICYMAFSGFLIVVNFTQSKFNTPTQRSIGQLRNRSYLNAPKACFRELGPISKTFKEIKNLKNPFL